MNENITPIIELRIERTWAMPSKNTLDIKPIKNWAKKYLDKSTVSADPFALNCQLTTYTNDLNPNSKARFHMKACDFLMQEGPNTSDLIIFDPPYSLRQVKECYENYADGFSHKDSQNAIRWTKERDIIKLQQHKWNVVLSFGWTSTCMGKKRGYEIDSILLCSHGPAHNDTLCVAEIKQRRS